jgi:hypothetical protein
MQFAKQAVMKFREVRVRLFVWRVVLESEE